MNSIEYHKKLKGKLEVISRAKINTKEDLSLAYTPGVAEPCLEIAADKSKVYDYTRKGNMVAIVTDGSAVLGLGNIGPEASLPVMEGKAILFKEFGDVDAFPIALTTQNTEEIIETVKRISPMFGGINLEDIAAPRCFEIEERLAAELDIPVFHDDQHGTAIVCLAGLYNALKVVNKKIEDVRVVMSGVGAAGVAITKLFFAAGVKDILLIDSKGIICSERDNLNSVKQSLLPLTNKENICGSLEDAIKDADVFIGVSKAGLLTQDMVKTMASDPIIFAMANPTPEIMPDLAKEAGAAVVATGRSDFANQINNVLVFPGLFRGLFQSGKKEITMDMKLVAAKALAEYVTELTADMVIPAALDKQVAKVIAKAVAEC